MEFERNLVGALLAPARSPYAALLPAFQQCRVRPDRPDPLFGGEERLVRAGVVLRIYSRGDPVRGVRAAPSI